MTSSSEQDPIDDLRFEDPPIEGEISTSEEPQPDNSQIKEEVYKATIVAFAMVNQIAEANGVEKFQFLEFASYGDTGRAATDHLVDRYGDLEAIPAWLKPVFKFVEENGPLVALGFAMGARGSMELSARRKAKQKAAADAAKSDETQVEVDVQNS